MPRVFDMEVSFRGGIETAGAFKALRRMTGGFYAAPVPLTSHE
jgi:hypothetical protein